MSNLTPAQRDAAYAACDRALDEAERLLKRADTTVDEEPSVYLAMHQQELAKAIRVMWTLIKDANG